MNEWSRIDSKFFLDSNFSEFTKISLPSSKLRAQHCHPAIILSFCLGNMSKQRFSTQFDEAIRLRLICFLVLFGLLLEIAPDSSLNTNPFNPFSSRVALSQNSLYLASLLFPSSAFLCISLSKLYFSETIVEEPKTAPGEERRFWALFHTLGFSCSPDSWKSHLKFLTQWTTLWECQQMLPWQKAANFTAYFITKHNSHMEYITSYPAIRILFPMEYSGTTNQNQRYPTLLDEVMKSHDQLRFAIGWKLMAGSLKTDFPTLLVSCSSLLHARQNNLYIYHNDYFLYPAQGGRYECDRQDSL